LQAIKVGNTLWTDVVGKTKSGVGLAMIAVRLAEAGRFSEAQEVTQQIQDDSYQVLAMIGIADEYIKAGQNDKALKTLSATSKLVSSLRCDCAN
jgi:predicted negative regulator of RcsB-dependent stress response